MTKQITLYNMLVYIRQYIMFSDYEFDITLATFCSTLRRPTDSENVLNLFYFSVFNNISVRNVLSRIYTRLVANGVVVAHKETVSEDCDNIVKPTMANAKENVSFVRIHNNAHNIIIYIDIMFG